MVTEPPFLLNYTKPHTRFKKYVYVIEKGWYPINYCERVVVNSLISVPVPHNWNMSIYNIVHVYLSHARDIHGG